MSTPLCTKDDVKIRLAGQAILVPSTFDTDLDGICGAVTDELYREIARGRGITAPWSYVADSTASARLFTGRVGNVRLLPIDDATEVTAVTEDGVARVRGTDYEIFPLNGAVITGLIRLSGTW